MTIVQIGEKHVHAKPLRGLGSGVLEVMSDYRGDTFRAVYAVRFVVLLGHDVEIVVKKRSRPRVPARLLVA